MALVNTWVEWAKGRVLGDKTLSDAVDTITKDAPIISNMPMEDTSDGFIDNFEIVTEVDGIAQTDLDAPIPEIDLSSELDQVNLNSFSGRIVAGIDKLKILGKTMAQYVSARIPKHVRKTMEKMEVTWIYNFALKYAIANYANDNTRVIDGTGSNNTNYSILAVRWESGETTGLRDPNGFGTGQIFDEIPESGGNPYRDPDNRTVQSMVVKNYIGFKFANPHNVVAMVNIDVATVPTKAQLGLLIDGSDGADALYMHPTLARAISDAYGTDKISYSAGENVMAQMFRSYDDTPIITSRNFKPGTEANVTL